MKHLILILTFVFFPLKSVFSQFTVMLNDKPVKQGDEIELTLNPVLVVGFTNPARIPEYTIGRATLYVNLEDTKSGLINQWVYEVNGYSALENFLYPKKSKTYTVWFSDGSSEMTAYSPYKKINTIYEDSYGNILYRKLTVTVNLIFEESIGYDKYAKKEVLLDKFSFNFNVWGNSNIIDMPDVGAKYNYAEGIGYKKMRLENSANYEIPTLGESNAYRIDFEEFNAYLSTYTVDGGKTQDDFINDLKQIFEKNLNYYANKCNGKKILKNIPVADETRDWKGLSGISGDETLIDLDQKNNPNFGTVKMFETVNAGSISGYKFKAVRKTHQCSTTSMIVATVVGPADPKNSKVAGSTLFYLLKHPTNPQKIIIFSYKDNSREASETTLNNMAIKMEQFLAALSFN